MSQFLFYEKIIPLDREQHGKTKIAPVADYTFTATVNSVPITAFEFAVAVRDFPLVFVASVDDTYMPAAMLGVKSDKNSFVDDQGRWTGKYIPLYIRQYPFMAAEKNDSTEVTICIDDQYKGVGAADGQPLFDKKGKETPWLMQSSEIAAAYLAHMKRTIAFCRTLQEFDLLEPLSPKLENNRTGEISHIQGLHAIAESRVNRLSDADALTLFRSGELAWIYLHLASLANFGLLANR